MAAWAGSFFCLWSWALDSSGGSTLVTLAAMMFALAASASSPVGLSRIAHWIGVWLGFGNVGALELLAREHRPAGKAGVGVVARAVNMTVMFAVFCGVVSTIAVYGGAVAAHRLRRHMLWTPLGWTAVKLVVQFVGMLPMAIGIAAVAHGFSVLRRSFGRDPYGALCRDWLWAMAVGMGLFGLLWWWGMHMLILATLMVMLLVAAMLVMSRRGRIPISRTSPVLEPGPQRRGKTAIPTAFAVLTLILLVQWRLLGDIVNLGFGVRICCTAASLALLSIFIRRTDRKSRPPGQAQELGCAIGAVAVAIMQVALAIACYQGRNVQIVCGVFAVACQLPLMAMAAVILSRRRRLFAAGGGRFGAYVSRASAGVGIGVLIYIIVCSLPAVYIAVLAAVLVIWVNRRIRDTIRRQKRANERMWAAAVLLLMGAITGVLTISVHDAKLAVGPATPGFWLSAVRREGTSGDSREQAGCLPILRTWRSERITQAIAKIMSDPADREEQRDHRGRWWVVAGDRRDLPKILNPRVHQVTSVPDPAAVPPGIWGDILVRGSERDFLQAAQAHNNSEKFDVVFLAPLRADHNQAWRCYNYQTLVRCMNRVHRGGRVDPNDPSYGREHPSGIIILRTQAAENDLAAALAVARTFHSAVGPSWAVVELHEGMIDMLLVGPAQAITWRSWREGLTVVSTEELSAKYSEIATIGLVHPPGRRKHRWPGPGTLDHWVRTAKQP